MSECQSTYHGRPCNDHGAGLHNGHYHANTYTSGRDTVTTSWNDSDADDSAQETSKGSDTGAR